MTVVLVGAAVVGGVALGLRLRTRDWRRAGEYARWANRPCATAVVSFPGAALAAGRFDALMTEEAILRHAHRTAPGGALESWAVQSRFDVKTGALSYFVAGDDAASALARCERLVGHGIARVEERWSTRDEWRGWRLAVPRPCAPMPASEKARALLALLKRWL